MQFCLKQVPFFGQAAYNTPYQLDGIIEAKMKKIVTLIAYFMMWGLIVEAQPEETPTEDQTCLNSKAYDLAYEAGQKYAQKINNIPGVLKIEIGNCSEAESMAVTSSEFKCGVFVWFENDIQREVFHQTTSLWGGLLKLDNGVDVPFCSKIVQQMTSKGGLY